MSEKTGNPRLFVPTGFACGNTINFGAPVCWLRRRPRCSR